MKGEAIFTTAANSLTDLQKNVAIIVDEMYIKSEVSYCSGSLHGFAENANDAIPASTMLTIMVQSLCGNFRDVVAFLPVKNMTGDEQTAYMKDAIFVLENAGFRVSCVICDNSKVNRVMMKNFGVVVGESHVVVDPIHPADCVIAIWFLLLIRVTY